MMRRLVFVLTMVASVAHARPITLAALNHLIASHDAPSAVAMLEKNGQFDFVLDQVERGKGAWIAAAGRIASATDTSNAIGLRISLARALPLNATAVLRAVDVADQNGASGIDRVCSVPFIESTPAFDRAYTKRAQPAVRQVRDPDLIGRRDRCLQHLAAVR